MPRTFLTPLLTPLLVLAGALAFFLWPATGSATEGGLGRPITGQQIAPNAGIVPPHPGWAVSFSGIYFKGDLDASRQVPIAGQISTGIEAKASYNIMNVTRIWPTNTGSWNFASAVGVPLQYVSATARFGIGGAGVERSESTTGIADLLFTPIIAGKHFSETEHMSLSLPIYAPTASYSSTKLANDGQNTWTFMPTVAYTRLGKDGSEFTAMGMLQFYTRNKDTDYQNGTILVSEVLWTKRVAPSTNLGAVAGLIYQLNDDKGPTADRLNGFNGNAWGLGPIVSWSGKLGGVPASVSARWVFDVNTRNRPKGSSIAVSLSWLFL